MSEFHISCHFLVQSCSNVQLLFECLLLKLHSEQPVITKDEFLLHVTNKSVILYKTFKVEKVCRNSMCVHVSILFLKLTIHFIIKIGNTSWIRNYKIKQ